MTAGFSPAAANATIAAIFAIPSGGSSLVAAALALILIKDVPIRSKPESIVVAVRFIMRDRRVVPSFLFSFAERFSAGYLVFMANLSYSASFHFHTECLRQS